MVSVLLVEDDATLGVTLKERLIKQEYDVTWVTDLSSADKAIDEKNFSLIILDVGLPDGSGFEFASKIKSKSTTPFIFVTAQTSAEDRLKGYELGAEEFIPKPFHLKEFFMRVDHVIENHNLDKLKLSEGDEINFSALTVNINKNLVNLTLKEMSLLKHLIARSPQAVSRDEILNKVWSEDEFPSNRTIDNLIVKLRQVLTDKYPYINSVRGVGYQWIKN